MTEAQIRFLKAKLRVMQEELDRLSAELSAKVSHFTYSSIYLCIYLYIYCHLNCSSSVSVVLLIGYLLFAVFSPLVQ